jgi:AcrR family transcriptional regulator
MPPSAEAARKAILGATEQLLRGHGAGSITVDAVAQAAGCAKGLVHYHFGTKTELLREALLTMTGARETKWIAAMNAVAPEDAIDETWQLILEESQNGTLRALASFAVTGDPVIDRAVRDSVRQFGARLTDTVASMLDRADLTPAIPAEQIGWMIAAVVQGTCQHLIVGAERETLENAYATAWLGVLSLTRPSG